ncbi:unnamed protein product [Leptidea sinapis]|uniref:Uncharacterized protein n=1 Tax=Leptidea sinapis TaxID=189913 RepID=A0A5E4QKJ3_9NEOP|nr:unnamed protein product [Leptidea sinapis]
MTCAVFKCRERPRPPHRSRPADVTRPASRQQQAPSEMAGMSLKGGEITVQHLMQQLGNPGLQSRHREMQASPLPGMSTPNMGVAHQPLRLSPISHSGQGRIPSPREMAHTQSLMQGAMLKKKIEEQRDLRRRHEVQQIKPPTQLAFTPTSVLRKRTADKEEALSPKPQMQQRHAQWYDPAQTVGAVTSKDP